MHLPRDVGHPKDLSVLIMYLNSLCGGNSEMLQKDQLVLAQESLSCGLVAEMVCRGSITKRATLYYLP